jgi:hypothetical protein
MFEGRRRLLVQGTWHFGDSKSCYVYLETIQLIEQMLCVGGEPLLSRLDWVSLPSKLLLKP